MTCLKEDISLESETVVQGSVFGWEDSVELQVTMMDDSLWEHN
jgi:hypothetical protein